MIWMYCVDALGLEGILEHGRRYLVRKLPVGAVNVRIDGHVITCAGSRFSEVPRD